MRIRRLELKNFRTFGHVIFEDIPDTVVIVSPNGRGKSSILEAIAGAKDLVAPYHADSYPIREQVERTMSDLWPRHLSEPIKVGENSAEIYLEVEGTGSDLECLRSNGIDVNDGHVRIHLERGRYVKHKDLSSSMDRFCRFNGRNERMGFFEYIRPVRFYERREIGNFTSEMHDDHLRSQLGTFHRPNNEQGKFSSFKSFVISSSLSDFVKNQQANTNEDSLKLFKQVFDSFFAPKTFYGYCQDSESGTPAQILVDTPYGKHDTDSLSDGEKEILHILAHLYRFRARDNIVLWDTPELHLNAALESRLYSAIRRIAPKNQYWLTTHSLELINSVPLESLFVIRQKGNSSIVERASGNERRSRLSIYQEMGAQIGLQLVSTIVTFLEGKESNSDKQLLDRLVAHHVPGVNFVAGGSCDTVFSAGTRANRLLEEVSSNGDFFAVVDRDYRDDDQVQKLVQRFKGKVFVWNSHEIENLFLESEIVYETLSFLGQLQAGQTKESIQEQLLSSVAELTDWIASDWIAWEFHMDFHYPERQISGEDPKKSLLTYVEKLKEKVNQAADFDKVEVRLGEKRKIVEEMIRNGEWIKRLPGKQILQRFLQKYQGVNPSLFMSAAANITENTGRKLHDIERLKNELNKLRTASEK